jgi:SAM-dependent methyltransferase
MRDANEADLYGEELAPWFHLLTPPSDYVDDAAFVLGTLHEHIVGSLQTALELGCGGGNTASHLKAELKLTLTDVSPAMLAVSASINPECEHIVGDMRTLRLRRTFDAVLIHDAICYMTTEADLRAAIATAAEHLRPGGVAVFEPDHVREQFEVGTDHGGEDGLPLPDGRPGPGHRRGARGSRWRSRGRRPRPGGPG